MLDNFDISERTLAPSTYQPSVKNAFSKIAGDGDYLSLLATKFITQQTSSGNTLNWHWQYNWPIRMCWNRRTAIAYERKGVQIGNNTIREFSTIHRPTDEEHGTVLGNNNYIMAGAHVNHDCILEDDICFATTQHWLAMFT